MADPAPYTVGYSFAGFQANNPTTPLPAASLDAELADVMVSTQQLVAAIESVRRSDGALKNGIVTYDSLEAALQFLVDPTNATAVANAVAGALAAQAAAAASATGAAGSATSAASSAAAAAASAGSVNLSLYLAKSNNLAGLGSIATSRANLGLGSAAVLNADGAPGSVMVLDGSARVPDYDGSRLTGIDVLPVGAGVIAFSGTALTGTLGLNGTVLSRATYARLWAYAQASGNIVTEAAWAGGSWGAFSTGDLSTTFRIPDARGEFLRGFDNGRGIDAARAIGAWQGDLLKDHTHNYQEYNGAPHQDGTNAATVQVTRITSVTGGVNGGLGGAETRPRNIPVLFCIKY